MTLASVDQNRGSVHLWIISHPDSFRDHEAHKVKKACQKLFETLQSCARPV